VMLDEAEELLKKALDIKPDSGHILDSLGWVYFKKGDFDKAIVELEKALQLLPEDPVVIEHLGDAYLKYNEKQKALSAYESAVRVNPGSTELQDKLEKLRDEFKASK